MASEPLHVEPDEEEEDVLGPVSAERTDIQYCRVCAFPMPAKAKKCTKCDSWTKKRWVTMTETMLTLVIALLSVLGTLAPQISKLIFRNSDTSVSLISAEGLDLFVAASNSGPRSSAVRGGYIEFVNPSNEYLSRMELSVMKSDKTSPIAMPDAETRVLLRPTKAIELRKYQETLRNSWINYGELELTVNVQESSDDISQTTPRKSRIAAKYLEEWITRWVTFKK